MLPLPHLFPQLELSLPKCPMPVVYSEPHAKPSFCSFIKPGEMDGGAERFFLHDWLSSLESFVPCTALSRTHFLTGSGSANRSLGISLQPPTGPGTLPTMNYIDTET